MFAENSRADETPVVLREWAAYAGNTDSAFVVPVLNDGDYTYSATYKAGLPGGVDIVLTKYDKDGHGVWQIFWTGSGVGRDQPSDMVMDEDFIYLSGITYSSANNYDFLTMQIAKSTGTIGWVKTYNSSFSNYDVATSIGIFDNALYVTGVSYRQTTLADYHTIKYNLSGDLIWERDFDYASLMDIPFDLSISEEDSTIVITGASQSNMTDWDYQTVIYDTTGTIVSQPRTSGSAAGFDRASAVKTDENGFIYITGATKGGNGDFDIKTVKLYPNGNLVWADTYDSGGDDMGNDLLVDKSGNVYICGESHGNDKDFFVRKTDANRNNLWIVQIDGQGYEDIAYKMCFDSDSNIIVTGKGFNPQTYNYDFLTVAFKPEGGEMWRDYFDGPDHGTDEARNIVADTSGNIFVTGQVERNGEFPTVTIKYRTDFFSSPPAVDSPAVAYLFYPNEGQILDSQDSSITDSTHYYMLHHYPQLFYGYGVMNMVFSHVDQDTSTTDTLQRVDVSFLNSTNPTEAFPVNVNDSTGYLNYYLGHCPTGITHVNGSQKLLYTDVWDEIDAEYSSNDAGLKLTFIVNPGSTDLNEIGLKFDGQTSLSVLNNWQLRVTTLFGTYDFEKPKVYQLDTNNNRISLPWYFSWVIQNGNEARFTSNGAYDDTKPLIIEISRSSNPNYFTDNLLWSTYYGGGVYSFFNDVKVLSSGIYIAGETDGPGFPVINGVFPFTRGMEDAVIIKMNSLGQTTWATFLGGSDQDWASGITADDVGNVYVTGNSFSSDFSTFQSAAMTNVNFDNQNLGSTSSATGRDIFITKINSNGLALGWSTFYGANQDDEGAGDIEIDGLNNLWVVGNAGPNSRVVTSGTYNVNTNGGLICKLDLDGNAEWITKFGSGGILIESIAFDSDNNPVICGEINSGSSLPIFNSNLSSTYVGGDYDGFVAKFDQTDNSFIYCTFLGSSLEDEARSVKIDANDNAAICGRTSGSDFFLENEVRGINGGSFDAFITVLNSSGLPLFSDYYGGSSDDQANDISFDTNNNILIVGDSYSNDFPIPSPNLSGGYSHSLTGQTDDFILGIKSNFSTTWATQFGGNQIDNANSCAINNGNLYVVGGSSSDVSFPLNNEGGIPDFDGSLGSSLAKGTISKFNLSPFTIGIEEASVSNPLSLYPCPVSTIINYNVPVKKACSGIIEIVDIMGNSVLKQDERIIYPRRTEKLYVENLANGIYVLRVQVDELQYASKFIVNK